ncbi:MAG: 23S rRNA (pseudouridine1915-N3)-methyltransferase, partial [Saprospiraceae bacterium]
MKVEFWMIGKTAFSYLEEGMAVYEKRLKHYLPLNLEVMPDIKNAKNLSSQDLKAKEGALILKKLKDDDLLILLDEKGKEYSSLSFSTFIEKQLSAPKKRIVFQLGGAYGFSSEVYERADMKISLSKMTFSHQMIRLFFLEQLYR